MGQQRPHSPESPPPQSWVSVPGMTRNVTNLGNELAQHGGVQQVVIGLLKSAPHAMKAFRAAAPQARPQLASQQCPRNPSNSPPVTLKLQPPHPPMVWPLWGLPRLGHRTCLPHVPPAAGLALTNCPVMSRLRVPAFCNSRRAESNRSWERPTVAMAPLVPTCSGSIKGVAFTGRMMGLPRRKRTAYEGGQRRKQAADISREMVPSQNLGTEMPPTPRRRMSKPHTWNAVPGLLPSTPPLSEAFRRTQGLQRQPASSSGTTRTHLH